MRGSPAPPGSINPLLMVRMDRRPQGGVRIGWPGRSVVVAWGNFGVDEAFLTVTEPCGAMLVCIVSATWGLYIENGFWFQEPRSVVCGWQNVTEAA